MPDNLNQIAPLNGKTVVVHHSSEADWKELIDKNNYILCVFLDLKRAFETIDRKKLLRKLNAFGIKNEALKWFVSQL